MKKLTLILAILAITSLASAQYTPATIAGFSMSSTGTPTSGGSAASSDRNCTIFDLGQPIRENCTITSITMLGFHSTAYASTLLKYKLIRYDTASSKYYVVYETADLKDTYNAIADGTIAMMTVSGLSWNALAGDYIGVYNAMADNVARGICRIADTGKSYYNVAGDWAVGLAAGKAVGDLTSVADFKLLWTGKGESSTKVLMDSTNGGAGWGKDADIRIPSYDTNEQYLIFQDVSIANGDKGTITLYYASATGTDTPDTNVSIDFSGSDAADNVAYYQSSGTTLLGAAYVMAGSTHGASKLWFGIYRDPATMSTVAISSAVTHTTLAAGDSILVTTTTPHKYKVGDYVTVAGTTGNQYNGANLVLAVPSATTFVSDKDYIADDTTGTAVRTYWHQKAFCTDYGYGNGIGVKDTQHVELTNRARYNGTSGRTWTAVKITQLSGTSINVGRIIVCRNPVLAIGDSFVSGYSGITNDTTPSHIGTYLPTAFTDDRYMILAGIPGDKVLTNDAGSVTSIREHWNTFSASIAGVSYSRYDRVCFPDALTVFVNGPGINDIISSVNASTSTADIGETATRLATAVLTMAGQALYDDLAGTRGWKRAGNDVVVCGIAPNYSTQTGEGDHATAVANRTLCIAKTNQLLKTGCAIAGIPFVNASGFLAYISTDDGTHPNETGDTAIATEIAEAYEQNTVPSTGGGGWIRKGR